MIKQLLFATAAFFSVSSVAAQTIPQQLDKLAKDPTTAERAARADVYILGKKVVDDSTGVPQQKAVAATPKKKKKACKKQ